MSDANYVVEVNETNINDIVQMSARVPVLLDFWADWCEPCKALAPVLDALVTKYQGKFILAKVDTEANPGLCQQLGVRSIPALKLIVQGQLAGELNGAQPASEIEKLLQTVLGDAEGEPEQPDENDFFAQIERARGMGAYDQAIDALQSAIAEDSKEIKYQTLLSEVLMDVERLEDAQQVLDNVTDEKAKAPALARLFFLQEFLCFDSAESLQFRVAQDANDMEARYYLACNCVLAGEAEAAMELLLEIVQKDRSYKDDGARLALLKIFDMLEGKSVVAKYRRRLFANLH
ncbi:tetratricopeptide repeat protein [Ketobacter sp. MCCC 1A13808]|uniref:tetratricopeptide repeat protein n=1 Tax=Ketobacter sp. MCCC 1A13808 TaxID=2602738 RepID=UPI0012EB3868|nr:tetratricopeptide repeat protein [Ketobacter sp. MCCC 1A13808]MVF12682.1 tetratricopeptide repeat protein [Ketobacter sp. MCCC 1A13808]